MSIPRFEIHDTSNQEFRFRLIAANNEVLLTSETYHAVASAKDGISAVRTAAQTEANFKRLRSVADEPYFTLVAANNKVVAVSEMYSSIQMRDKGIEAVKRIASSAEVFDARR
jgi:uncharacterized protein